MQKIKNWLEAQNHVPGPMAVLTNPFYLARRGLYRTMCRHNHLSGRVLDVGCGTKPYKMLFPKVEEYLGLELDTPENRVRKKADAFYEGDTFPFSDAEFDGLLCNQVLEHVFTPERFVAELYRIMKPGGKLLLTVPFAWDEHEQPFDYARYSSFGLGHLLAAQGFEIIEQEKIGSDVRVIFQLWNGYVYKRIRHHPPLLRLVWTVFLMSPVTLMGLMLGSILPDNPDLYLDNLVLACKPKT
jgi:SAM-dependent methyltransferase